MAEKQDKQEKPKGLIAFAPFYYNGKVYKTGDPFDAKGLERDPAFDEQFQIERRRPGTANKGISFIRDGRRAILPVKEQ